MHLAFQVESMEEFQNIWNQWHQFSDGPTKALLVQFCLCRCSEGEIEVIAPLLTFLIKTSPCIIILMGVSGSGKSTIGKQVSSKLDIPFWREIIFTPTK